MYSSASCSSAAPKKRPRPTSCTASARPGAPSPRNSWPSSSRTSRTTPGCDRRRRSPIPSPGPASPSLPPPPAGYMPMPGTALSERKNEIVIGTDENAPVGMCFMPVTDPKTVKNRMHLDLTSSAADRAQEIDRLLALGARRVDIGQTGAESWTVLADPEGNEFCVVRPKETLIG